METVDLTTYIIWSPEVKDALQGEGPGSGVKRDKPSFSSANSAMRLIPLLLPFFAARTSGHIVGNLAFLQTPPVFTFMSYDVSYALRSVDGSHSGSLQTAWEEGSGSVVATHRLRFEALSGYGERRLRHPAAFVFLRYHNTA
ncbi:MAG: hypothetical protein LBL81_02655 [Tannerella sp.]|nr:hypothetical protein [Tannerella sp.]